MTITMPPWLEWLSFLAGSEWPQGDEDQMFALAEDWQRAGTELLTIIPDLRGATSTTLASYTGDGADVMKADFDTFFAGDHSIEALAKSLTDLGKYAKNCGTQIEYSKLQIITTLAITAAEIAWALSTLFGSAAVPAIQATGQVVCQSIARQLLTKIVSFAGKFTSQTFLKKLGITIVAETIIGFAQEFGIQAGQVGAGHRDNIDWKQVGIAAATSAAGAAVAFPVGHGAGLLLNKKFGPATSMKGAVARALGAAIPAGLAGVGGGFVMGGLLTGEWEFDPRMLGGAIGGALSGGVSGATDYKNTINASAGSGGNNSRPPSLLGSDGSSSRPPSVLGSDSGTNTPGSSRPSSINGDAGPASPTGSEHSETNTTTTQSNDSTSNESTSTTNESGPADHTPTGSTTPSAGSGGSTTHQGATHPNAGSSGETALSDGHSGTEGTSSPGAAATPNNADPVRGSTATQPDTRPTTVADTRPTSTATDPKPSTPPRTGTPSATSESTSKSGAASPRAGTAETRADAHAATPVKAESTGVAPTPARADTETNRNAATPETVVAHLAGEPGAAEPTGVDRSTPDGANEFVLPRTLDPEPAPSVAPVMPATLSGTGSALPTNVPTDTNQPSSAPTNAGDSRPNPSDVKPPAKAAATTLTPAPSEQITRPKASLIGDGSTPRATTAPTDRPGAAKLPRELHDTSTPVPVAMTPDTTTGKPTRPDPATRPPTPKEPATPHHAIEQHSTDATPDRGYRTFADDGEGERYGEETLGRPIRDALPPDQFHAVRRYTEVSFPNAILRSDNTFLHTLAWDSYINGHLAGLNGGQLPTVQRLVELAQSHPDQLYFIDPILRHPRPDARLQEIAFNATTFGRMWQNFDVRPPNRPMPPTIDEVVNYWESDIRAAVDQRLTLLDSAVAQPLPQAVRAIRGLHDARFLNAHDGNPLGDRTDLSLLEHTIQQDPAYLSTSLGNNLTVVDGKPFKIRMEIDIPKGGHALWMGPKSAYPDQRELILPRGTRYEITKVENVAGNTTHPGVETLIKARVVPINTPDPISTRTAPDLAGGVADNVQRLNGIRPPDGQWKSMPGKGDCLFHALSEVMGLGPEGHVDLRGRLAIELNLNREHYLDDFRGRLEAERPGRWNDRNVADEYDRQLASLLAEGEYRYAAGNFLLPVAAHVLGLNLTVLHPDGRVTKLHEGFADQPVGVLYRENTNGGHYHVAVHPDGTPATVSRDHPIHAPATDSPARLAGGATHSAPLAPEPTSHQDDSDTAHAVTAPSAAITPDTPEVRHFATNEDGHFYGETTLGPIRDSLSPTEFGEAYRYTVDSWINHPLRTGDIHQWVKDLTDDRNHYNTLLSLTDEPSAARLYEIRAEANAGNRSPLTEAQSRSIEVMLSDGNPDRRIDQAKKNAEKYEDLTQWLDGRPPTTENLTAHRDTLDRALGRNLPEPVEVVRGVTSAKYMRVGDGILGAGDPLSLKGTIQIESGYLSTSLGATPPSGFHGAIRLELELPNDSTGLWMGSRSAYPEERELILPRGTRYLITDVIKSPPGDRYNGVEYLLKGRVQPTSPPVGYPPPAVARAVPPTSVAATPTAGGPTAGLASIGTPDLAGGATNPATTRTDSVAENISYPTESAAGRTTETSPGTVSEHINAIRPPEGRWKSMPGEGDCLFHALSETMGLGPDGHLDLRARLASELELNREHYLADFRQRLDAEQPGRWHDDQRVSAEYHRQVESLLGEGVYRAAAGNFLLPVAARVLELNLVVLHPDGGVTTLRHGFPDQPVGVLFREDTNGGHYHVAVHPDGTPATVPPNHPITAIEPDSTSPLKGGARLLDGPENDVLARIFDESPGRVDSLLDTPGDPGLRHLFGGPARSGLPDSPDTYGADLLRQLAIDLPGETQPTRSSFSEQGLEPTPLAVHQQLVNLSDQDKKVLLRPIPVPINVPDSGLIIVDHSGASITVRPTSSFPAALMGAGTPNKRFLVKSNNQWVPLHPDLLTNFTFQSPDGKTGTLSWNGKGGGLRFISPSDPGKVVRMPNGAAIVATPGPGTSHWIKYPKDAKGFWVKTPADTLPMPKAVSRFHDELFRPDGAPRPEDVAQGKLGDCYLLADLKSLAANRPVAIREIIHDYRDGTVGVRFFVDGAPEWVRVTKQIYVDPATNEGYFAGHRPGAPLWPALIEKAYVVRFGGINGYHGIVGGVPGITAEHLSKDFHRPDGGWLRQPVRSFDDSDFLHPMRFSADVLHAQIGGDPEFVHKLLGARADWEQALETKRNEKIADLVKQHGYDEAAGRPVWLDFLKDEDLASPKGFEQFVKSRFPAEWSTERAKLDDYMKSAFGAENHLRTLTDSPALPRAIAEQIDYALARGDMVVLGTRTFGDGQEDTTLVPGLVGGHAYPVVGIERDGLGQPVRVVLENPWNHNDGTDPATGARVFRQPAPGIEYRTDGQATESRLRRGPGVLAVDLEHLPKFGTLSLSGAGAYALHGPGKTTATAPGAPVAAAPGPIRTPSELGGGVNGRTTAETDSHLAAPTIVRSTHETPPPAAESTRDRTAETSGGLDRAGQAEHVDGIRPPEGRWKSMPGDGDCLFHALSETMGLGPDGHLDLRARLAIELNLNSEHYLADFRRQLDAEQPGRWSDDRRVTAEYHRQLESLLGEGEYRHEAGNFLLPLAARALQLNLVVLHPDEKIRILHHGFPDQPVGVLYRENTNGGHYHVAVRPDGTPATVATDHPIHSTATDSTAPLTGGATNPMAPATPQIVRFASNNDGEHYGESVLGPIRDSLPAPAFVEAHRYTVNSWINFPLRNGDIQQWVTDLSNDRIRYDTLFRLTNSPPTAHGLHTVLADATAGRRVPLTFEENQAVLDMLRDPAPDRRIELARANAETHWSVSEWIGGTLTAENLNTHALWLDQAVGRDLPAPLEVVRGMRDVSFLRVGGAPLGTGDPRSLRGTVQIESGYMSTSLGATPPGHFDGPIRMELELPPAATGLWMGPRSAYPDQRELILPRGTRYLITDVIENPQGTRYTGVRYLVRGRIEPRVAPVVYIPPATATTSVPPSTAGPAPR
ncbi:ADP-ribosyltransferase [Nocardia brasiliensis]|uniref:ADP-ribosyltransferase n=1 Tax=Nocardia brasiliensis TaxID=37326 RepID=UPI00366F039F